MPNDSSNNSLYETPRLKAGNKVLRQVLIVAAHRLIRFNPEWKAMSDRLLANGKTTCVIVAAVANRWVRKQFRQMADAKSVRNIDDGF